MKQGILIIFFTALLFSCKKEKTPGNEPKKPVVYISGWVYNPAGNIILPCYWKDSSLITLDVSASSAGGVASHMVVINGDIYVLGSYSINATSCIWKNGIRTDLTAPAGKFAYGTKMFISGPDVYVGGYSSYNSVVKPCFWKNGQYNEITDASDFAYITCIAVSGSDIYLGGTVQDRAGGTITGCYWKNGVRVDLPRPATNGNTDVTDITIQGSTVFVSGSVPTALGSRNAVIWKDNILNNISSNIYSKAWDIDVAGDQVYACGYYNEWPFTIPCYWKNGIQSNLPLPVSLNYGNAYSVFHSGQDVYIAGWGSKIINTATDRVPCAWKNGKVIPLSMGSNTGGEATSVFIEQ